MSTITKDTVGTVEFKALVPHPDNIREELTDIESLAASIEGAGLLTPLRVRAEDDGTYTILAGHRRHAALQHLKTKPSTEIPVLITSENGTTDFVTMLVENLQRVDIDPIEQGAGLAQLVEYGLKQDEIAKATGFSKSIVSARITLSKLPPAFHGPLRNGSLKMETALDYVRNRSKIPQPVQEKLEESADGDTFNFNYDVANAIRTAIRQSVIAKGMALVAKLPKTEGFSSEADVPVPEGQRIAWSNATENISEIKPSVKMVIVGMSANGKPSYRAVEFIDEKKKHSASDQERAKKQRDWKVEQLDFWTEVLANRPNKGDAATSAYMLLRKLAAQGDVRIACKILGLEPNKVQDPHGDEGKLISEWNTPFDTYAENNSTKAFVALQGAMVLGRTSSHYTDADYEAIKNFWG